MPPLPPPPTHTTLPHTHSSLHSSQPRPQQLGKPQDDTIWVRVQVQVRVRVRVQVQVWVG